MRSAIAVVAGLMLSSVVGSTSAAADASTPSSPLHAQVDAPREAAKATRRLLRKIVKARGALSQLVDPRRGVIDVDYEEEGSDARRSCGAALSTRIRNLQRNLADMGRHEDGRQWSCSTDVRHSRDYAARFVDDFDPSSRPTAECRVDGDHDTAALHLLFAPDPDRTLVLVGVMTLQENGMGGVWHDKLRAFVRRNLRRLQSGSCAER